MKFEVKNRHTGNEQFVAEIDCDESAGYSIKLGLAVKWGVKTKANLYGADLGRANLYEANLYEANLYGANLYGADLDGANLYGADLGGANLYEANLGGANLYGANLGGANLYEANLYGADLGGANLRGANLRGADLSGANLRGADLSGTNLRGTNLRGADLSGADLYGSNLGRAEDIPEIAKAQTLITPEGDIVGWKKCQYGVIIKMLIPSSAKRHNATGRKCRAEYVDVLEVIGAEVGISQHDRKTEYRVGQRVSCDKWGEDRFVECAGGIHFFITRIEAENY